MESEKVKEIKKALEICGEKATCQGCPEYNSEPVIDWFNCKKNLLKKTLTLINELESENERFAEERDLYKEQFNELEPRFLDLRYDNQELKNRIDELEKYIKGNEADAKAFVNGWHKDLETSLKQFAERLKEELKGIVGANFIDQILKEFL